MWMQAITFWVWQNLEETQNNKTDKIDPYKKGCVKIRTLSLFIPVNTGTKNRNLIT